MIITGAAILLMISLIVYMHIQSKQTILVETTVVLHRLGAAFHGTKLLFISDFHSRELDSSWIESLLKRRDIELVLVGGDIVDRRTPLTRAKHNAELLRKLAPVYYVHGNSDYRANYRALDIELQKAGVKVLDNEAVYFEKGTDRLWLVGVDDPNSNRDKLRLAYAGVAQDEVNLLLAHDPLIVKRVFPQYRTDLILCGHTHGGQIHLPWLGPFYMKWFSNNKQYIAGLYRMHGTQLLVSRGYGTSRVPLRLNCPPEVHIITLSSRDMIIKLDST